MKRRLAAISVCVLVLSTPPAACLMELFTTEPMGLPRGVPEGLRDLVNNDARIAGMVGPIADTQCFYAGDTATLNSFLVTYSELPDDDVMIRLVLHQVPHRINMKRFDTSD